MALSKKIRRYRGYIAAAALVAIGGAVWFVTQPPGDAAPRITYTTEPAATGTLSVTVSGTGNIDVLDTTDVWPAVAGTVATLRVKEGDIVEEGAVLFTLEATETEAAKARAYANLLQARQGVIQAESQLLKARNNLDTLQERYYDQQKASSVQTTATAMQSQSEVTSADISAAKKDIEAATLGVESAKTNRTAASTSYEDAKDASGDLTVKAPRAGIVWSLDIEVGDTVQTGSAGGSASSGAGTEAAAGTSSGTGSGAPLVLAPSQPLGLVLSVNEVDVPSLELGQRVDIEVDALPDLALTGKVTEIVDAGTVNQGVVTYEISIALDVSDPGLKTGMSATAMIVTEVVKDALIVPNGAVKSDDQGEYVEVLDEGTEVPRRVAVESGLANATDTQILTGLSQGDRVVTLSTDAGESQEGDQPGGGGFMMGSPGMGGGPGR